LDYPSAIKAQNLVKRCISYYSISTLNCKRYGIVISLISWSLEAPTSATCNHESNQKPQIFLASMLININIYVSKNLNINQAYIL